MKIHAKNVLEYAIEGMLILMLIYFLFIILPFTLFYCIIQMIKTQTIYLLG